VNDPLIWLRACHFAATASLAGALLFYNLVGGPAVLMGHGDGHEVAIARRRLFRIAWISFACVLITGAGWFFVQAAQMADVPPSAVFTEGTVWNILLNTDFGNVSAVRTVLAALFAAAFLFETARLAKPWTGGLVSTALAVSIAGALAFSGHASAGSDAEGWVHLGADFLHLVAAAAWLGALLPLALVLNAAHAKGDEVSIAVACIATQRFSSLGIASVGTLVISGIVNSWFLLGSVDRLLNTDYGRLLSLKLLLFLAMLSIAAVNRLRLTSALSQERGEIGRAVLRQLRNNSLMETMLGLIILYLVGILGTLPPGSQE
jgi:putative copper resistance protein D